MARALENVVVVDFTGEMWAGLAGALLGDFGADVIRVEDLSRPARNPDRDGRHPQERIDAEAELIHHESASRGDDMAPEHYARFKAEVTYMRETWGPVLDSDPCYNPNFSRANGNFQLADRFATHRPWQ